MNDVFYVLFFFILSLLHPVRISYSAHLCSQVTSGCQIENLRVYPLTDPPPGRRKQKPRSPLKCALLNKLLSQTPSATKTGLQSFDGRGKKHSADI